MNKSELIDVIANSSGVTKADTSRVLDAFKMTIFDALKSGDEVVLPGLGSFCTTKRAGRTGRNPRTGETIKIRAKRVPKFKPGKNLKEAVE